ncbi:hypothetical protein AB0K43_00250 [Kitasatospora sp. NPDC049258]|uniref:hypothetical protein n=1 Tax=Kitasatospora sp. NPDC049258 TaxID=3155394 RepID=UPI0034295DA0
MSDLPHAHYLAAVHAALTAEGLGVRRSWSTELTHRAWNLDVAEPEDSDCGFTFEPGHFQESGWSDHDWVQLGWEHHRGWHLMEEDSGLLIIPHFSYRLGLSELFADPADVATAVRRWLPGPGRDVPELTGRWSGADRAEADLLAWHEGNGHCFTRDDEHRRRDEEEQSDERPAGCRCSYQPCGFVAVRDIRSDCSWHATVHRRGLYRVSSHGPTDCPDTPAGDLG